jgi:triphosphoribosyl-dephospho-CoA synthase
MFRDEEDAATAAVLAMLLEVSAEPKAGNVDRSHSYPDLRYEHFLASSAASYPVFLEATKTKRKQGELVLKAIENTMEWHRAQNVHFGAFLLLVPLLNVWDSKSKEEACINATENLKKSSHFDSLNILRAFKLSSARVMNAGKLDLTSDRTEFEIEERRINLFRWMKMAPRENLIARELTENYRISLLGANKICESFKDHGDINLAVLKCYYSLLSEYRDPLIIAKFGEGVAAEVSRRASEINRVISDPSANFKIQEFDDDLVKRGINPGTIADLTISSIYLALMDGLRF